MSHGIISFDLDDDDQVHAFLDRIAAGPWGKETCFTDEDMADLGQVVDSLPALNVREQTILNRDFHLFARMVNSGELNSLSAKALLYLKYCASNVSAPVNNTKIALDYCQSSALLSSFGRKAVEKTGEVFRTITFDRRNYITVLNQPITAPEIPAYALTRSSKWEGDHHTYDGFIGPSQEAFEWLWDNNIECEIVADDGSKIYIIFPNERDEVLFKMFYVED